MLISVDIFCTIVQFLPIVLESSNITFSWTSMSVGKFEITALVVTPFLINSSRDVQTPILKTFQIHLSYKPCKFISHLDGHVLIETHNKI
jgi:hypothetical protein